MDDNREDNRREDNRRDDNTREDNGGDGGGDDDRGEGRGSGRGSGGGGDNRGDGGGEDNTRAAMISPTFGGQPPTQHSTPLPVSSTTTSGVSSLEARLTDLTVSDFLRLVQSHVSIENFLN